jgi:hypothetical protein
MSSTTRLIIALILTGSLAALATPELAAKLPEGLSGILAAAFAAILHRMNAEAPAPKCEHEKGPANV